MKFRNVWKQLKTSQKDSLKAILLVLIAYMIVLKINLAEMLAEKLEAYEEFQLDEVPFLLLFV
ncbi:MAG TPA: two-component sensor histidine kinase, partial [Methylotenera sp.]|nr:two-component sensor histidine kinase [Methylotenera sp.]